MTVTVKVWQWYNDIYKLSENGGNDEINSVSNKDSDLNSDSDINTDNKDDIESGNNNYNDSDGIVSYNDCDNRLVTMKEK